MGQGSLGPDVSPRQNHRARACFLLLTSGPSTMSWERRLPRGRAGSLCDRPGKAALEDDFDIAFKLRQRLQECEKTV